MEVEPIYKNNMEYPIKEKWFGNKDVVAELEDFQVLKFAPTGLLDEGSADVMCLYKKKPGQSEKDRKKLTIFGGTNAVFDRVQMVINRTSERNKDRLRSKFIDIWTKTPLTQRKEKDLFNTKLTQLGLNAKKFGELSGLNVSGIYHHTKGKRDISKEVAEKYAEQLNCDPVDLMFEKKTTPIWSKVNLLKSVSLEEPYAPGRLYSYGTLLELESAVVPRDYWREDIKAIKIDSRGSMYHNQVGFYYRANTKADNVINKLCVVGINVRTEVLDEDQFDEHYYFGLYEEVRGQSNLVNPDPFVQGEDKYILKNFEPTFIAPIVLMVNPEMVVDQTQMKNKIPRSELINKEEQLRMQLQQKQLEISVLKHKMEEKDLAAKSIKDMERAQRKVEEELKEIMAKVEKSTRQINEEMQKNKSGIMSKLFQKERDVLDKLVVIEDRKKRA